MRFDALKRFDSELTHRLREFPSSSFFRTVLSVAAHSGDSAVLIPCLFGLWWLSGFSRQSIALPLAAGYAASVLVTSILKYSFRRRRPPGQWGLFYRMTDPHSFPSGHASRTAVLTVVVLSRGWILIGMALLIWSLLVGLARIILGVHYLYDVLAGYLLGLVIGVGVWLLLVR